MPSLIVTTDRGEQVLFWERVSAADFESRHFAEQLVQRLRWALADASEPAEPEPEAPPWFEPVLEPPPELLAAR